MTNAPEVLVRRADSSDVQQLTRLMLEYIVDFYKSPEPPLDKLQALMRLCAEGKEGAQFVAEAGGKLYGFATLYFTYSTLRAQPVVTMNDLYVIEAARGTGVAAALFEACRDFTRDNGFAFMQWETAHDNVRAQRFYDRMGGTRGDWLTYYM